MKNDKAKNFTCEECGGVYRFEDGYRRSAKRCGCCINKEDKTTPRPWKLGDIHKNKIYKGKIEGWESVADCIPLYDGFENPEERAEANAKFIVKAVNEYQDDKDAISILESYVKQSDKHKDELKRVNKALLKACKVVLKHMEAEQIVPADKWTLSKAIAQAEGGVK